MGRPDRWPLRFWSVFGLGVFAVSLPILRLVGDAPEFFIAHHLGRGQTVGYVLVLVLVLPAALGGLASLPGSVGRMLRGAVLVLVGGAAVASILQPVSNLSGLFTVAVLAGAVGLAVADRARPSVRSTMAWMAIAGLLLPAWTLGPSRVGRYVRSSDAVAVKVGKARPLAPVVVIVFDEFPLTTLLDSHLQVDAAKFPNFAAFAATSDWFRSASSVSPQTSASVPALLSGMRPRLDSVPVSADHPSNLFLQLGRTHEVHALEPITSLCPSTVCHAAPSTGGSAELPPVRRNDAATLVKDTAVVLGHGLGSDALRSSLPSISQGWAGFTTEVDPVAPDPDRRERVASYGTFPAQAAEARSFFATRPASAKPLLLVAHLIAPHQPWVALPDGSTYGSVPVRGLSATVGWSADEASRRAGYQRLLLQVGALDRVLGQIRTELERSGTWDQAVVALVADHGIQFEPGGSRAIGSGGAEVSAVPMFIKRPHQRTGRVDDRAALTIDLVPSILDRIGARTPTHFDGIDLYREEVPATRAGAFLAGPGQPVTPAQGRSALDAVVERRSRWIDPDGGWAAVYQPGVRRRLVGRGLPARSSSATPTRAFTRTQGEQGAVITGSLAAGAAGAAADRALLVACGGRVAGATALGPGSSGATAVQLVADPGECGAPDQGELWLLDDRGRVRPAGAVG